MKKIRILLSLLLISTSLYPIRHPSSALDIIQEKIHTDLQNLIALAYKKNELIERQNQLLEALINTSKTQDALSATPSEGAKESDFIQCMQLLQSIVCAIGEVGEDCLNLLDEITRKIIT
jgi:hypothetical protein